MIAKLTENQMQEENDKGDDYSPPVVEVINTSEILEKFSSAIRCSCFEGSSSGC